MILAPEIALTPQLETRVRNQFGNLVGIYHSKMTPSARYKAWKEFRSGEIKVIIGTRSAVMMPALKLGLIIIDEEHDASYKQQEGFKFSARDIAIKRAQIIKIPMPTPIFIKKIRVPASYLNFLITRVFKGVYTLFVFFKRNIYNGHLIT